MPEHIPWRHTAHGARWSTVHGSQQSDVCVQPDLKKGMHVGISHTPGASGMGDGRQTRPGAHTGGELMNPPQGPPTPETQSQNAAAAESD